MKESPGCERLWTTATLEPDRVKAATTEVNEIQHDLDFLRAGNDIHNIHFASKLEELLLERVSALCRELGIEAPTVTLPPPQKQETIDNSLK